MSSKRWDKDQKARLIHLYTEGKSFSDIAEKLERSESAIRLRLQTIVYDGIAKGLRAADLSDTLGADLDAVIQMFYTHRDFKESRGEEVISLQAASKLLFGSRKTTSKTTKTSKRNADKNNTDTISDLLDNSTNKSSMKSNEVNRLARQNRTMEAIINNRELRKKIKKLYKDGKLNDEEKELLENILS